jgi:hypothetical protein
MEYASYGAFAILCAVISAKWALDLGFSQSSQFIWGIGGMVFGPLLPLVLYIRLVRRSAGVKD